MEINHSYQSLADNMALGKYKCIEIWGYEGRGPEKVLNIHAYESKDTFSVEVYYRLQEKHRESVKNVAAQHSVEYEELPDLEIKTEVPKEFEEWLAKIKENELDKLNHYEKAVEFAKELSHGVVRGYWKNEIAELNDIIDLMNMRGGHSEFNIGRERLARYMTERIGYGSRTGQSYTTQRGWEYYHGNDEASNMDLMISAMVGIGLLKKVDDSKIYELTGEAFALLKKPSRFEKYHSKIAFWVSIVAMILSIILGLKDLIISALRELGVV